RRQSLSVRGLPSDALLLVEAVHGRLPFDDIAGVVWLGEHLLGAIAARDRCHAARPLERVARVRRREAHPDQEPVVARHARDACAHGGRRLFATRGTTPWAQERTWAAVTRSGDPTRVRNGHSIRA